MRISVVRTDARLSAVWGGRWTASLPGVMAAAAWAGAAGLLAGRLDLGATVVARLPFASPALAAIALAAAVGTPMTWATVAVARGDRNAGRALVVAGSALVAWIVVEVAVISTVSWLQPICLAWGLLTVAMGAVRTRHGRTP